MRRRDDVLWKGILEDVFDDFLRFLNPEAESLLDLDRGFEFLDKELQQVFPPDKGEFSLKVVDKLVKVFTKNGDEEWILVHVEVQGQYQQDFASRMFRYYYRLIDKYNKPLTTYAIFTEAGTKPRPDSFERDFMGTSLKYKFNTYKIASQSDEELLSSNNPFALVVLVAKTALAGSSTANSLERDEHLLKLKLELAKQLLKREIPKEKIRVLMNFLRYYTRFENAAINSKFEQAVETLTERSTTMGIEELLLDRATKEGIAKGRKEGEEKGEAKGRQEGRKEGEEKGIVKGKEEGSHEKAISIAKEMIKDGISVEQIAKFTKLSFEEIKKL